MKTLIFFRTACMTLFFISTAIVAPAQMCDDDDNDGVCNENDMCPNFDDQLIGSPCDDNDDCTVNDVYNMYCACSGTYQDSDGDGICDSDDICPGLNDNDIGGPCDDNDNCTDNDVLTIDCECIGTFTDSDGDGVCDGEDLCPGADDSIDDNDNGIPDACESCVYELIDFNNFNSNWGIWNDGGSDCRRSQRDAIYANGMEGRCVRLRDNTNTSVMTTDNIDLSNYDDAFITFNFLARSMDNTNEDFWLQLSTDGGSTFTTVETWALGVEFLNDQRYFEELFISGPFTSTTQFRFRCDASGNQDWVYIDDVAIEACSTSVIQGIIASKKEVFTKSRDREEATQLNTKLEFIAYPNPFSDEFYIEAQGLSNKQKTTLNIFSVDGRLVHNRDISTEEQNIRISIGDLESGQYVVRLSNSVEVMTKMIIKQ